MAGFCYGKYIRTAIQAPYVQQGDIVMCDYSLEHVATAKAARGSKIVTSNFQNTASPGFAFKDKPDTAACLLPGTEIAFDGPIQARSKAILAKINGVDKVVGVMPKELHSVVKFVQVNQGVDYAHHDAVQFPTGEIIMLYQLDDEQEAKVIQMPADPSTLKNRDGGTEIHHREHEHA